MSKSKWMYWISTSLVAAVMLWSAINFSINPAMREAFAHLGLPNWFRVELSIAKVLGVLALLLPITPRTLREAAYAGFALTIVSAVTAHGASGDGALRSLEPLVFLALLAVSYVCGHEHASWTPSEAKMKPVWRGR